MTPRSADPPRPTHTTIIGVKLAKPVHRQAGVTSAQSDLICAHRLVVVGKPRAAPNGGSVRVFLVLPIAQRDVGAGCGRSGPPYVLVAR